MKKPNTNKKPTSTKDIAKKIDSMRWDSSKETMQDYIERISKLKKNDIRKP